MGRDRLRSKHKNARVKVQNNIRMSTYIYVTSFGKIGLNAANNFFQYHRVKLYGSIFFEKFFMAEMDRHQLALAYDAVISSGVL